MWDYFDQILCINLVSRDDRYESSKKFFKDCGIDVEYFRTSKHPNGGCEGCFRSHIECMKIAYDRGAENLVIFEDDLDIRKGISTKLTDKLLSKAIEHISANPNWDIFYLGATPNTTFHHRKVSKSIIDGPCLGGYAYIVSRKFMKRMINFQYDGRPIDQVYVDLWKSTDVNAQRIYPPIFVPGDFGSDIETSKCWFGVDFTNNFRNLAVEYTTAIGLPYYYLIILIIILIILAVWVYYLSVSRQNYFANSKSQFFKVSEW